MITLFITGCAVLLGGGVGNDLFNRPFTDMETGEIKAGGKKECEDTSILEGVCWYARVCMGKI